MAAVLDLRPNCELCDRDLPPDSTEAMICTFTLRPIRPKALLDRRPPSAERVRHPLDSARHGAFLARYRDVPPERR
jgi:hypothetical protein